MWDSMPTTRASSEIGREETKRGGAWIEFSSRKSDAIASLSRQHQTLHGGICPTGCTMPIRICCTLQMELLEMDYCLGGPETLLDCSGETGSVASPNISPLKCASVRGDAVVAGVVAKLFPGA